MLGNLIGTDATGTAAWATAAMAFEIENSSGNIIGGDSSVDRNVISGNACNGVLFGPVHEALHLGQPGTRQLDRHQRRRHRAARKPGQRRGIDRRIGQRGRRYQPGSDSPQYRGAVGAAGTGGSPGNVISGNDQWGVLILLSGASAGQPQSVIEGNVIGAVDESQTYAIGNGQGGVFVNNVAT